MPLTLIIKSKLKPRGRNRSDWHKIMKAEGWQGAGLTDEQADKSEFLERMAKKEGIDKQTFFKQSEIDKLE